MRIKFNAPFPVPAANPSPSKAGHLYVAFTDKAQNADPNDAADVFFVRSTDGGLHWDGGTSGTTRTRISTVPTNDQWMPVLAVKPDGTQLFVAWYDRRNDINNSRLDVYGRWGAIANDGTVTFDTECRISTESFPPVFAGTLAENTVTGYYDPVYPPAGVDLNWWYPEWPDNNFFTPNTYAGHVGEYNGVCADSSYVYFTWTDSRLVAPVILRAQRDIRFVRLLWP